mmetsp:Transcript_20271/g.72164  ORF Transcript_20271/g.72164 Transcript_20271/m.72164 type:complete len:375 (-) Transcript_20271:1046-2170(-)
MSATLGAETQSRATDASSETGPFASLSKWTVWMTVTSSIDPLTTHNSPWTTPPRAGDTANCRHLSANSSPSSPSDTSSSEAPSLKAEAPSSTSITLDATSGCFEARFLAGRFFAAFATRGATSSRGVDAGLTLVEDAGLTLVEATRIDFKNGFNFSNLSPAGHSAKSRGVEPVRRSTSKAETQRLGHAKCVLASDAEITRYSDAPASSAGTTAWTWTSRIRPSTSNASAEKMRTALVFAARLATTVARAASTSAGPPGRCGPFFNCTSSAFKAARSESSPCKTPPSACCESQTPSRPPARSESDDEAAGPLPRRFSGHASPRPPRAISRNAAADFCAESTLASSPLPRGIVSPRQKWTTTNAWSHAKMQATLSE